MPLLRVLVTFSWLERAPGARGRRRRAARALSELMQPKKIVMHVGFVVRLYKRNTPHRPRKADFRSTAPFSRSGMRLFNGLGCSVSCSAQATSFRKATSSSPSLGLHGTVGGLGAGSQLSRSSHCERPAEDASSCAMARAGLTAPRTSMSCRLLRTSSRLSVLFLEQVGQRGEWRTVFCALRCSRVHQNDLPSYSG